MQLPENEENIVEDQPTEEVDSDADDNENQEDFSEESEEENPESSLENEDYPGEDVVEIINLQGETTTVYKLVDAVTWIALILSIFMMEKTHGQIQMVWSGIRK